MALLAGGKLENVYASLDVYLQTQLVDQAGLTLHLHGVRRFVPPTDTPWVEAHYAFLGLTSRYFRQIGGVAFTDTLGVERVGHIQLNIYQRARVFTQRYTTAQARDLVVQAFPEGGGCAVYDGIAQIPDVLPEQVGTIYFDGLTENVADSGLASGITQHVVMVTTRYIESYTR